MKTMVMGTAAAAAMMLAGAPAQAAITVSASAGNAVYSGPTPTYDFETAAPLTGGSVVANATTNVNTRPLGSTGNFAAFGPSNNGSGTLSLSSFADIYRVSFIWGSVDGFNTLEILGAANTVLRTIGGNEISSLTASIANSEQRGNPLVTLTFSGADISAVEGLRFSATGNAFEIDNVSVAVPEPATWAMMLVGFGLAGLGLRRRRSANVRFA